MPRRPRIHLPDLALHTVQRDHNRDARFLAEENCLAYREWLGHANSSPASLARARLKAGSSAVPQPHF